MSIAGWIDFNGIEKNCKNAAKPVKSRIWANICGSAYLQYEAMLLQKNSFLIKRQAKDDLYTIVFCGRLNKNVKTLNILNSLKYNCGDNDAQTVLCSYIQWGEKCLDYISGAFAFAIWKENQKSLFIARDRMGIVPLYYYKYTDGFVFGDMQALLDCPVVPRVIDIEGIMQLFYLGPGKISGSGILKDIYELKPAHFITLCQNDFNVKRYWKLTAKEHTEDFEQTATNTRHLLEQSAADMYQNNAACMLSGGLDSGIVCALLNRENIDTYSVDFEDNEQYFAGNTYQPERDNDYINIIAGFLNTNHNMITLNNADVAAATKQATAARVLPGMADVDSSLLLFCKKIAKKHKICYSGECADEIFAGYPWYHKQEMLQSNTFPWSQSLKLRKNILKKGIAEYGGEFVQKLYDDTISQTDYLPTDSTHQRRIREMFVLNYNWFMQTLLDRGYKMAAACGLEIIMPFCNYKLAEYAYNMPWEFKAYKGREKGILRYAFKDLLPPQILFRKKSPFPKTYSPQFFNIVKKTLKNILSDKNSLLCNIIDADYVISIMDNIDTNMPNWYGQLMRLPQLAGYLIQIDYFFKKYNVDMKF